MPCISAVANEGIGEERTAGSDQKARYSSGGPISLDQCFWYTLYLANIHDNFELLSIGGGEGGRGEGGGEVNKLYIDYIQQGRFYRLQKYMF